MYNTPLQYGAYVYPRWGKALGVCMGATCCLQIPIWAIVAISKESGTLKAVSTVRPISPCLSLHKPCYMAIGIALRGQIKLY